MALFLRCSRVMQASLKIENKLNFFSRLQVANSAKCNDATSVICNNSSSLCRRLYSTNVKASEAASSVTEKVKTADAVLTSAKKDSSAVVDQQTNETKTHSKNEKKLLNELQLIDEQVKRYGRIDKRQVEDLLKKSKKGMSSIEAAMLLRCCGSLLVKETVEIRRQLLEKVWKKVEECCPAVTTEVINAFLSVKIENQTYFDPAEELAKLEQSAKTPTRATYNLLLAQYCELGNIEGASEVLNYIKSLDWPVDISVIHSLITGYMRRGDFQGAKEIIMNMNQHGLRPNNESYTTLLLGCAEKGDIPAIKEVMRMAASKEIRIPLRNAYDVAVKLAVSGHGDKISEVMDILGCGALMDPQQFNYNRRILMRQKKIEFHDSVNCLNELMACKQMKAIIPILKVAINKVVISEELKSSFALQTVIYELVKRGEPVKDVLSTREMLVNENLMSPDLEGVASAAMKLQKTGYILEMLEELKNLGMVFKPHYFWPIFYKAKMNKNVDEIYEITKFCVRNVVPSLNELTNTIYDWSFENLIDLKEDPEVILEKYKKLEMHKISRDIIETTYLMKQGKFAEAQQLIEEGHQASTPLIKRHLFNENMKLDLQDGSFFSLLNSLKNRIGLNLRTNSSLFISSIKAVEPEQINKLLENWIDNDFKILKRLVQPAMFEAQKRGASKELIEKIATLSSTVSQTYEFDSPLMKDILVAPSRPIKKETNEPAKKVKKQKAKIIDGEAKTSGAVEENPVEIPKDETLAQKAQRLLHKREYKDFKQLVFDVAGKGDVDTLNAIKQLNLPKSLTGFFGKSMFFAHLESNKTKEFVEELKANPQEVGNYLSLAILLKLAEKDSGSLAEVEEMLKKTAAEELKDYPSYANLYNFYLIKGEVQKIDELFKQYPVLKEKIRLGHICSRAKLDKNEKLLRQVIEIHKNPENVRRIASPYNNLLLIKCEANDSKAAMDIYNEGLSQGMTFDNFSIRALRALQSVLQGSDQPLPWKEGELEKKIELAAKKREELSSDSE